MPFFKVKFDTGEHFYLRYYPKDYPTTADLDCMIETITDAYKGTPTVTIVATKDD